MLKNLGTNGKNIFIKNRLKNEPAAANKKVLVPPVIKAANTKRKNVNKIQSLKGKIINAIIVIMLVKPSLAPGAKKKGEGNICSTTLRIIPCEHKIPVNTYVRK